MSQTPPPLTTEPQVEPVLPPPPPLQIGIPVTGPDANSQAAIAAKALRNAVDQLDSIRLWSEQYTEVELESLGFQVGTGIWFKSAMGEVPSIVTALQATQFLKKLWGTGL
jgi:hypothetical protein